MPYVVKGLSVNTGRMCKTHCSWFPQVHAATLLVHLTQKTCDTVSYLGDSGSNPIRDLPILARIGCGFLQSFQVDTWI
jgi:hypothetical protein